MSYINSTPTRTVLVTFASRFNAAAHNPEVVEAVKEGVPVIAAAAKHVGNIISTFRGAW